MLFIFLFSVFLLPGCAHSPENQCVSLASGYAKIPPCWLFSTPQAGLVLEGSKGVGANGWSVARAGLLRAAMLEFAIARFGEGISADSLVTKKIDSTRLDGTEKISRQNQSMHLAVFQTHDGQVNVKARVEDYFYNFATEKIYLWITEQ